MAALMAVSQSARQIRLLRRSGSSVDPFYSPSASSCRPENRSVLPVIVALYALPAFARPVCGHIGPVATVAGVAVPLRGVLGKIDQHILAVRRRTDPQPTQGVSPD